MKTLSKLTLVSAAVLQSGMIAATSANAADVSFVEETTVGIVSTGRSLAATNEITFTETKIRGEKKTSTQKNQIPAQLAGAVPFVKQENSEAEVVFFQESVREISAQTSYVELNKLPTESPLNSVESVSFSEEIFSTETPAIVSAYQILESAVTGTVTTNNTPAANSNSEVVFIEESPVLAAARPVRRQTERSTEALEALREQIRSKSGSVANSAATERNNLAALRSAQADSDELANQQGRLILLTNVNVEGNTVIDESELARVSAPFVGRRIMLSDLEELRVKLTEVYAQKGYINSGVLLPDQKVENGNIVYQAVEGTIAEVNIEGEGTLKEKYITDRLKVEADQPFNSLELQENFQLLLDDPLFDRMDGKLRSLPGQGASALDLQVTRARPYDFSITTSNHGTPSLGAEQVFLTGVARNVSGNGDILGITAGGNGSKFSITTEYEIPIRADDTRVKVRLTGSNSSVAEEPLDSIDIESSSLGADLSITRPLKRSIRESLITGTGISIRKSHNSLEDVSFSFSPGEEDGRSKVSVARLWLESVKRDDLSVLAARATLNLGLDMFGSTIHDDSRPDSDFLSGQAQLQYARKAFDERAQVIVKLEGQISNRELLPLERFALGGADTVRGYRENELVRDQVALASAELQYPFYRSPDFGNFKLAPFIDVGYGKNKTFFKADQFLASVGLGLLWDLGMHISGELYFGASLKDGVQAEEENLQDRGVHLKVVAKY